MFTSIPCLPYPPLVDRPVGLSPYPRRAPSVVHLLIGMFPPRPFDCCSISLFVSLTPLSSPTPQQSLPVLGPNVFPRSPFPFISSPVRVPSPDETVRKSYIRHADRKAHPVYPSGIRERWGRSRNCSTQFSAHDYLILGHRPRYISRGWFSCTSRWPWTRGGR